MSESRAVIHKLNDKADKNNPCLSENNGHVQSGIDDGSYPNTESWALLLYYHE